MMYGVEIEEINKETIRPIPKMAGIYVVHCPKTGFTKFGRATELSTRISQYKTMCLNGGGIIVYYKVMSPMLIQTAEKVLLSIATTRLRQVDRHEYFLCDSEEKARKVLVDSIQYLTKYYVTIEEIVAPMVACLDYNDPIASRDRLRAAMQNVYRSMCDHKEEERNTIYSRT